MRRIVRVLGSLLLAAGSPAAVGSAATLTVTHFAESGAGSLGQAILDSNASVGTLDTIGSDVPGAPPFAILPLPAPDHHGPRDDRRDDAARLRGIPAVPDPAGPLQWGGPHPCLDRGGYDGPRTRLRRSHRGPPDRGRRQHDPGCFFGTDLTGTLDTATASASTSPTATRIRSAGRPPRHATSFPETTATASGSSRRRQPGPGTSSEPRSTVRSRSVTRSASSVTGGENNTIGGPPRALAM